MITMGGGILGQVSKELRGALFCSPSPEQIAEVALQKICSGSPVLSQTRVVLETVLNGASHGYRAGESIQWLKEAGEFYGKVPVHLPNKNVPSAADLATTILPIARMAAASFALARGEQHQIVEEIGAVSIERLPISILPSGRKTYSVEITFDTADIQDNDIARMRSAIADAIEHDLVAEPGWTFEGASSGSGTAEIGYKTSTQRVAKRVASAANFAAKRLALPISIETSVEER